MSTSAASLLCAESAFLGVAVVVAISRVRKMKERYAQSAMRKQTNRMAFAEVHLTDVL